MPSVRRSNNKMSKTPFFALLTAIAFGLNNSMAEIITDDFSTKPCEMLKGNDDPAIGKAVYKEGTISLSSSCIHKTTPCPITSSTINAQVDFYLFPGAHKAWESAALTLYGDPVTTRFFFMTLFGNPQKNQDICQIGLYPDQMIDKMLPSGKWYTMKISLSGGEGQMKVWEQNKTEPQQWDVTFALPGSTRTFTGVGMRTFGPAVQYDNLSYTSHKFHPLHFQKDGIQMDLSPSGCIHSLKTPSSSENIQFRLGGYHSGPAWIEGGKHVILSRDPQKEFRFIGRRNDLCYGIEYQTIKGKLAMTATLKNEGTKPYQPDAARLMLGINTEMVSYPTWNKIFFPTLLRGEKTHFWGYLMNPRGRILALSSPDPISSWNYEFQPYEHRIYTVSLDLLHKLPLPKRHPQNLTELKPGETLTRTFFLQEIDRIEDVKPLISETAKVPMFEIDRYTIADDEKSMITVFSGEKTRLTLIDPQGKETVLPLVFNAGSKTGHATFVASKGKYGLYTLRAENSRGKITEASIYVRHPWSWYTKQARKEAIRMPQKASQCCESWMGHYSTALARKYFPDPSLDRLAEENLKIILPALYDLKTGSQRVCPGRIQNGFYTIGLLTDYYRATGDIQYLEYGNTIANWLMKFQSKDGAYRNGSTHYTCVAYAAKSMLELAAAEKMLSQKAPSYQARYEQHFDSAKRAMEDLQRCLDNIQTEGQQTYEDGMISCSATQLALWALMQKDPAEREKFTKAATYMFNGHRCLDQMIVPDCRYNEGTLRFWEAQYDVLTPANQMNSPHGWTAWRIPGLWYMYLITGKEVWLRRAMNSLGSCVQLIDGKTGVLRHSFAQDPYVVTSKLIADSEKGEIRVPTIVNEQYIDMISGFHKPTDFSKVYLGYGGKEGCCDNDVHEVFKALEEVALTAAYVLERPDGSLSAYNCKAQRENNVIVITPSEAVVSRLHLNLKGERKIDVKFASGEHITGSYSGMLWIGPGGTPEDLR